MHIPVLLRKTTVGVTVPAEKDKLVDIVKNN